MNIQDRASAVGLPVDPGKGAGAFGQQHGWPFGVVYGSALVMISALFITGLWLPLRLTPVLNAARDAGDAARFARLHQLVLALTGASLLFGAAWLVALGWVLPAQYGMQHV